MRQIEREESILPYEIFCLATNHAWEAIALYRDHRFSTLIAQNLLNEADIFQISNRPLLGSALTKDRKSVKGIKSYLSSGPLKVVQNFMGRIDEKLVKEEMRDLLARRTLAIKEGGIRLHQQLSLKDYMRFLDYLSDLQDKANHTDTSAEPIATFSFWKAVKPVEEEINGSLKKVLIQQLWKIFCEPYPHTTALRFCPPRRINDYFAANCFFLSFPGKAKSKAGESNRFEPLKWYAPITASEVVARLEYVEALKNAQDKGEGGFQAFADYLPEMEFCFRIGKRKASFSFSSCFEGEIVDSETGRHYFHLGGVWYYITLDSIAQLHQDFQECL